MDSGLHPTDSKLHRIDAVLHLFYTVQHRRAGGRRLSGYRRQGVGLVRRPSDARQTPEIDSILLMSEKK